MRQSAAVAGRITPGVFHDAKIAAFAVYGYGAGMCQGRVNGATFERGFAADLLQVQRAEVSDSIFGCAGFDWGGEPGAWTRGERIKFTFYLFRLLTVFRHIGGPAFFSGT
jgi:hypothetical protein